MTDVPHRIVAMVEIASDDPRLDPAWIAMQTATVAGTQALRQAVVQALPGLLRVVAVMGVEEAKLMCWGHDQAMRAAGIEVSKPPPDYVVPIDFKH